MFVLFRRAKVLNWFKKLLGLFKPSTKSVDEIQTQLILDAIKKQKPKRPRLYKQSTVVTTGELPKPSRSKSMATAKKSVARKVTKEMEYDYKTGKKSFAGSTAKKDAHAEKEGKRVAKALAYDINKAKKKK